MTESYLTTHPHIRRILYGAVALAAIGVLGWMFGWDNIFDLGKQLLTTAGLIETNPGVKPP